MPRLYLIFSLFLCSVIYGQIPPERSLPFPSNEFVVYTTFKDSLNNTLYQIGRHEPKNYKFELSNTGKWKKTKIKADENLYHVYAPIYLKTQKKKQERFYLLDDYYDVDFYRFKKWTPEKLLFITARYHFHIFDQEQQILSPKTIPGSNQYEGEDAISGLYDALTLFNNQQFLLGNVQGFGVFCFDISNPVQPQELQQYGIKEANEGQYYAFFYPNNQNLFDVIIAQSDSNSENPNIRALYTQLKTVRYAVKNCGIEIFSSGKPLVRQEEQYLIFKADNSLYCIDLRTGTISKEIILQ
ncbi:hypothetical protein AS589_07080 [Empedobacter brevis]|uniref:hypothetical protein n=1 Tax=Empedobacter brevis TaxID=247 RepID=UPI00131F6667|nr:hypothetical protein [Empedobacter brevis]QHC84569.1 hypothetical protein AS589_07080 [Empedobacter brevis]